MTETSEDEVENDVVFGPPVRQEFAQYKEIKTVPAADYMSLLEESGIPSGEVEEVELEDGWAVRNGQVLGWIPREFRSVDSRTYVLGEYLCSFSKYGPTFIKGWL